MHLTKSYSLFRPGGCCALAKIANMTKRAILVLCARPNVVTAARAITSTRPARLWKRLAFSWTRQGPERRHHAHGHCSPTARLHGLQRKKTYGGGGQAEPVPPLLKALGDAPGDILRAIVRRGTRFGVGQPGENEKCRGGVLRRAGNVHGFLGTRLARHCEIVEEGATLEQNVENEELEGETNHGGERRRLSGEKES